MDHRSQGVVLDDADVAAVRRFNRTVTRAVGALDERYLDLDGSLGAARLLWEIGRGEAFAGAAEGEAAEGTAEGEDAEGEAASAAAGSGAELRALRERLRLDSGYLSRLLRELEEAGLVAVEVHPGDARRRVARVTVEGRARVAEYDERSVALVRSLVAPLTPGQRARLLAAMGEVDRLLTAASVAIEVADPESPEAQRCLRAYYRELDRRFPVGFDVERSLPVRPEEVRLPQGVLLLARLDGEAVGCGSLKLHGDEPAEIKRLWVDDAVRGLGLGRRLLAELERRAAELGADRVRLDTNASLVEAIALYRATGYAEIPPFTDEPYADFWFEKRVGEPPVGPSAA